MLNTIIKSLFGSFSGRKRTRFLTFFRDFTFAYIEIDKLTGSHKQYKTQAK